MTDFVLDERDVRIDSFTNASPRPYRLIHLPTGIIVSGEIGAEGQPKSEYKMKKRLWAELTEKVKEKVK